MDLRGHHHEEEFPVSAGKMFEILHRPSAICAWWNASRAIVLPEENGIWAAAWGEDDAPDYITSFTIEIFDPPKRMRLADSKYFAKSGPPPFEAGLTTEFIIRPTSDGCILSVTQDGFPADEIADEFYHLCEIGWKKTFDSIRKYLLTSG